MNSDKQYLQNITLACFSNFRPHNTTCEYKGNNPPNKIIQIICRKSFSLATSNFKTEQDVICKDDNNIYIALVFHQKVTKDLVTSKLKILIREIKMLGSCIQFFIIPIEIIGIMDKPNITIDSKMVCLEEQHFYKILNNVIDINKLDKKNFIKVI